MRKTIKFTAVVMALIVSVMSMNLSAFAEEGDTLISGNEAYIDTESSAEDITTTSASDNNTDENITENISDSEMPVVSDNAAGETGDNDNDTETNTDTEIDNTDAYTVSADSVSVDDISGDEEYILPVGGRLELEVTELSEEQIETIEVFNEAATYSTYGNYCVNEAIYQSAPYEDNVYDCYCSYYYFNQLNDAEKADWLALKAVCDSYLSGTNAQTDLSTVTVGNESMYILPLVRLNGYPAGASKEEIAEYLIYLSYRFVLSNPQYFFIQTGIVRSYDSSGNYYLAFQVDDRFDTGAERYEARNAVFNAVQTKYINQLGLKPLDADATAEEEYKFITAIQSELCKNVTYDHGDNTNKEQTVYSTFANNLTVCAGYATAMSLLCNYCNIDCICVVSTGHEWNMVRYQDNWYEVDVTWADQITYVWYKWFMKSYYWYKTGPTSENEKYNHTVEDWLAPYIPSTEFCTSRYDSNIAPPCSSVPRAETFAETFEIDSCTFDDTKNEYTISFKIPADRQDARIYWLIDDENKKYRPSEADSRSNLYTGSIVIPEEVCDKVYAVIVEPGYLDTELDISSVCFRDSMEYSGMYASLNDNIGMVLNFEGNRMTLGNPSYLPYIEYTYHGETVKQDIVGGKSTIYIYPTEMRDTIQVNAYFYDSKGYNYVKANDESLNICLYDYLKTLQTGNDSEYIRALLYFGASCQKYFDYNEDSPASEDITAPSVYSCMELSRLISGWDYRGTRVVYYDDEKKPANPNLIHNISTHLELEDKLYYVVEFTVIPEGSKSIEEYKFESIRFGDGDDLSAENLLDSGEESILSEYGDKKLVIRYEDNKYYCSIYVPVNYANITDSNMDINISIMNEGGIRITDSVPSYMQKIISMNPDTNSELYKILNYMYIMGACVK